MKILKIAVLLLTSGVLIQTCVAQQPSNTTANHIRYGASLPSNCNPSTGDVFFKTTATITPYYCSATNSWTVMGAAAAGTPNTHTTFTNVASVAITVTGTADRAIVNCWDNSTPPQLFIPDHITITDANTVTAYFVPNATGYCNTSTASGGGGGGGLTVAGSQYSVQVNDGSSGLGGDTGFLYNTSTHLATITTPVLAAAGSLSATGTFTSEVTGGSGVIVARLNLAAPLGGDFYTSAIKADVDISDTSGNLTGNLVAGGSFFVGNFSTPGQNANKVMGFYSEADWEPAAGTVTQLIGNYAKIDAGATVISSYGIYAAQPFSSASAWTNNFGIWVGDQNQIGQHVRQCLSGHPRSLQPTIYQVHSGRSEL